jgi:hypothetical protein
MEDKMSLLKEEMAELLRVRWVLSVAGYYVSRIEKRLGHTDVIINAHICEPGQYAKQILAEKEFLAGLPDDISAEDFDTARQAWHRKNKTY